MSGMKIGGQDVKGIYLGDTQIFGGLALNVDDNSFILNSGFANCITFINNSNVEIKLRIEGRNNNTVINTLEVTVLAKSVLVRPSYAFEVYNGGQILTRLTILTNVRYTSYSFVSNYSNEVNINVIDAKSNVENIVDNNLNVFDYRSSPRYFGSFGGTFLFSD